MILLRAINLSKYFGGIQAVNGVDLEVNEGEILGLIGPNGSGKTTFLNVVNGIYKPTSGKVIFQREEITGLPIHVLRKKGIGRTFQQNILFKKFTVWENLQLAHEAGYESNSWVSFFNRSRGHTKEKEIERATLHLLEEMDLMAWKNKLCNDIPHGIQRIVGVAIATVMKPKLVILDEPFSGMNLSEITNMLEQIKRLRENGSTILMVEHRMQAVMKLCDRIAALNFGRKIAEGLPGDISNNEEVVKAYLGDSVHDFYSSKH